MIHAEASTTIRRPVAEVFSYVTDPTNEPAWHTDAAEARLLTAGPIGVGSRIAYVFPFMSRRSTSIGEVVAFEPPSLEAIHFDSGPFGLKPRITYRFEDLGGSVRFTREAEADTPGLPCDRAVHEAPAGPPERVVRREPSATARGSLTT